MSQATGVKSAFTMESSKQTSQAQPTTDQIRRRAHEIYLSRIGAREVEVRDWLQAEGELRSQKVSATVDVDEDWVG